MPIEDADKVHSKRGGDGTLFTILGYKINLMKLLTITGVSIGGIFILVAAVLFMYPSAPPVIITNQTPNIVPTLNISLNIIPINYNYRIIQMNYTGTKSITDLKTELILSMYPPISNSYVQRQAIINHDVSSLNNNQLSNLYIYTGVDNAFHASYIIPKYEDCTDFINGDWILNIDDGKARTNLYQFKFTITNSSTKIISNNKTKINDELITAKNYSTMFIYPGIYKERLNLIQPVRLIGIGNPLIDAGGYGSGITIHSSDNSITGLIITNSGIKNSSDGGIIIMPQSYRNNITKNEIYKTIRGIWLNQANSNTIVNNNIHNNDNTGISLSKSSSNIITNNIIYNNIDGIYADSTSDLNIIRDNSLYSNTQYGVIIDNYNNLNNICEYNIYKTDKMLCSDSVNRDQISTVHTGSSAVTPIVTTTNGEDWSKCTGNPKCYQS